MYYCPNEKKEAYEFIAKAVRDYCVSNICDDTCVFKNENKRCKFKIELGIRPDDFDDLKFKDDEDGYDWN